LRDVATNEVVAESSVTSLSGGVRRAPTAEESARDAAARAETMTLTPDRIMSAQQMLNSLGYDCGEPTGVVDRQTRNAVIDYQFDQDLEITGWINESLVRQLETRVADLETTSIGRL